MNAWEPVEGELAVLEVRTATSGTLVNIQLARVGMITQKGIVYLEHEGWARFERSGPGTFSQVRPRRFMGIWFFCGTLRKPTAQELATLPRNAREGRAVAAARENRNG